MDTKFYRCAKNHRILTTMIGDDKVWCHVCSRAHQLNEVVQVSFEEFLDQVTRDLGKNDLCPT